MELLKIIREPAYLFLMLLFPAVLTLVFGLAFAGIPSGIPGVSQFEVMAPGLYAYACIFIIMVVAQAFTDDREQGLLERINTTPTSSSEFIASHIISNTIISLMQVVIVIILSYALGFRPDNGLIGFLSAFIFVVFLSITSVGLGLVTASISKSSGTATGLSFIFILPQMFFGTFVPLTSTTRIIAQFLPSYYVTEALTAIFNGAPLTDLNVLFNLGMIIAISIVIIALGILIFKKYGNK